MTREHDENTVQHWIRQVRERTEPLLRDLWYYAVRGVYFLRERVARYPLTTVGVILGFLAGAIIERIPLLSVFTLGYGPLIGAILGGFFAWRKERRL